MEKVWRGFIEDFQKWLADLGDIHISKYISTVIHIVLIVIIAKIIIRLGRYIIQSFFRRQQTLHFSMDERKAGTLSTIAQSILRYTVYFFATAGILSALNLGNTARSLLATAGIGGLAIGFGAQNLIKDIITGFFILFEDQFAVGDYIKIGDISGTVEAIGLRVTHIRGFKGDLTIIPNGSITTVSNFSRGNALAIVDLNIPYEADLEKILGLLERVCNDFARDNTDIAEPPQVLGVMGFEESKLPLRVIARTLPLKNWGVERELRKSIKKALDREGIEVPYPKRVMITKDKKGQE